MEEDSFIAKKKKSHFLLFSGSKIALIKDFCLSCSNITEIHPECKHSPRSKIIVGTHRYVYRYIKYPQNFSQSGKETRERKILK